MKRPIHSAPAHFMSLLLIFPSSGSSVTSSASSLRGLTTTSFTNRDLITCVVDAQTATSGNLVLVCGDPVNPVAQKDFIRIFTISFAALSVKRLIEKVTPAEF